MSAITGVVGGIERCQSACRIESVVSLLDFGECSFRLRPWWRLIEPRTRRRTRTARPYGPLGDHERAALYVKTPPLNSLILIGLWNGRPPERALP